ncbi:MAG TPA: helix-turn-helix transcriptional regulator [Opitutaceae bacterium]|nr:helix-turn-helix transcriptional regulator [Opitutaceae bacterium]HRJ46125.1 helix-turn-helix transcriptional regulator [Opitutaceae bacterium]
MPADLRKLPRAFGQTVRQLRLQAGLSQIELAEKSDLNFNYVGSVERGEKLASIDTVVRLARGLGVSGSELLRQAGY